MLESRTGKVLIIVYALFTIATYAISFYCGNDACGLYIILPIMPWAYILSQELGFAFPWAIYPILVLINVCVVYTVGVGIDAIIARYRTSNRAVK